ncbi:MAG: ATP-binding protein, partial [Muribaculaceae bacterium]
KVLEVDYVVNRGSQRIYIQSAYMLPDEAKTAQELRPFKYTGDEFRKVIISGDYMRGFYNNDGIYRIGIYNFLTDPRCLE